MEGKYRTDDAFIESFFQKGDLLPAIVQEVGTNEVLMLAYMNRESMKKTLETGYTWFYSRSRQELWNKGGHVRPSTENYQHPWGLRQRYALGPGGADGAGLPHRCAQLLFQ